MSGPIAANFHVTHACDLECRGCFATFPSARKPLDVPEAKRLIAALARAGTEKINFAGGEPTLYRGLASLIDYAKAQGLVTSVVTNGARAGELLDTCSKTLDWLGLSVDSANPATQERLGRTRADHMVQAERLAAKARAHGIGVKLNTVVSTLNVTEDLSPVVKLVRPARWKLLQIQRIEGENDGRVETLLISKHQFQKFVERHAPLVALGVEIVAEDTEAIRDSYAMIDPMGRFFGNTGGVNFPSAPILEVGVADALAQAGFDPHKLERRGGRWAW